MRDQKVVEVLKEHVLDYLAERMYDALASAGCLLTPTARECCEACGEASKCHQQGSTGYVSLNRCVAAGVAHRASLAPKPRYEVHGSNIVDTHSEPRRLSLAEIAAALNAKAKP
jgi:hypothetical protein